MGGTVQGDPSSMNPTRTILLLAVASIFLGGSVLRAETNAPAEVPGESIVRGAVSNEELAALANDVNLPVWMQLALSRSFTSVEEGWVAVYSPKDPVGAAGDWSAQLRIARALAGRTNTSGQRRWLELFVKAGEAVSRKDAVQFTAALRGLGSDVPSGGIALAANLNFFTAK